mgnify:CR=1 FL=1
MEVKEKEMKNRHEKVGVGTYVNSVGDSGFFVGNFPKHLAQEWEGDCKLRYKGTRWMKAYTDHCKSKMYDLIMMGQETEESSVPEPVALTLGKEPLVN